VRDWFRLAFFDTVVPDHGAKVDPNEKTYHPEMTRVLGFQPNNTSVPTWIKLSTERPSRAMPLIVNGRG
jgi:hypothetical protein